MHRYNIYNSKSIFTISSWQKSIPWFSWLSHDLEKSKGVILFMWACQRATISTYRYNICNSKTILLLFLHGKKTILGLELCSHDLEKRVGLSVMLIVIIQLSLKIVRKNMWWDDRYNIYNSKLPILFLHGKNPWFRAQ